MRVKAVLPVPPAGAADDALAGAWKAAHPGAPFRLDSEVGEACSGYNENYRELRGPAPHAP